MRAHYNFKIRDQEMVEELGSPVRCLKVIPGCWLFLSLDKGCGTCYGGVVDVSVMQDTALVGS